MKDRSEFHHLADQVQQQIAEVIAKVDAGEIKSLIAALVSARSVFVTGKGRTGLQMEGFAMRLMHVGLKVHVVGEVTAPGIQPGDLLLVGSASGTTGALVSFVERARSLGVRVAAITANREGPVARAADTHVFLDAPSHRVPGSELIRTVLPMGGLFEAALGVLLNVLVVQLMNELGVTEAEMIQRHANLE